MLRDVLAAIVGIAVAFITVMLIQILGHMVYPPPADLNIENSQAMSEYVAGLPVGALLFVLAGYLIGTFDGAFIASWIGRAKPFIYALIVGVLMLVATVSNLIMIPHPMWFSIAAIVGIVVAAWAGSRLAPSTPRAGAHTE